MDESCPFLLWAKGEGRRRERRRRIRRRASADDSCLATIAR